MSEIEDKTASLLAALWQRNRPLVEERIAVLERADGAAVAGPLSEELRREAQSNAHKLAGALGMYGYDKGTLIARQIEMLLESATPDAGRLHGLIGELRVAIFPQG